MRLIQVATIATDMLVIFMMPFALLGLFITVKLLLGKKPPMDTSNRINHIRLVWFAVSRPELFVPYFEWLKRDELDNIS